MKIRSPILLLFFSFRLLAQEPIHLYDTTAVFNIGKMVSLYEDRTASAGIDEVASPAFADKFIQSEVQIPSYNITSSKIWFRFTVINNSKKNTWYLESTNGSLGNVAFYYKDGSRFIVSVAGLNVKPPMRQLYMNKSMFHLELPADSSRTFYVCIWDKLPLQVNFSVGTLKEYIAQDHKLNFLNGAFFGLLLMLVIYNLFIYFSVRDKVFIFYVLYVASNALFISFITGYISNLPDWFSYVLDKHPVWVPAALGSFSCVFMIVFLDLKKTYRTGFWITMSLFFSMPFVLMTDAVGYPLVSIVMIQVLGLTLSVFSLFVGIKVWRRGYKPAKFFLLAFSFYLVGLFMYIAADAQLIPFNDFTHNALQIGTAFEAILLSLAVGDKISNFKKEKELAQENALISARENEKLVREQNVVLEQKVHERTMELQQQKEVVEEKNKSILDSIRYAQRIQRSLLPTEQYIFRVLNKFRKSQ